jgi:uracil phosphoribosyltransferase
LDGATQVDHPLIKRHITQLRDARTTPEQFRLTLRRLTVLLAYEATKDLRLELIPITTPMTESVGHRLSQQVGVVPILRAGLGMVDPVLDLLPEAQVWHLGLYRDETTAEPVEYYSKLPDDRPVDVALVLDPMLATGGSVSAALAVLQHWGVSQLKVLSAIASREGIQRVVAQFPQTQICVCAIDDMLNKRKFIVPGLGDAGDRAFNTFMDPPADA